MYGRQKKDALYFPHDDTYTLSRTRDTLHSDLVKRANDWLRENPTMTISNCETLCRMHTDRESAYDPELITMATSMSDCSQTYFVRGLR